MQLRLAVVLTVLSAAVACDKSAPKPAGTPSTDVAAKAAPAAGATPAYKVPLEDSAVRGSPEALVTMVEFSDYQCPFCSRAHATVRELEKTYGDKLRVVMKQNPLPFHDRAKPAAAAVLSAGAQGKFWEYHDKLFENQKDLGDADLERYAQEVGLDVAAWKAALSDAKWTSVIERDQALATKLEARGTPAFFINGQKLVGAQPVDKFKAVIDSELAKAQELVKGGTSASAVYAKVQEGALERAVAPPPPPPSEPEAPSARNVTFPADAPSKGPKNAKVTIVAWSDFQCPFCSRVNPTLKQVEETYGKDVRVVFRHQPLPFHDKAKLAAEASMAAHAQGKFWPYHDKLFANQQALDEASLEKYATELKLDLNKFKAALKSHTYASVVEKDSTDGNAVGANGTPSFFINGRELVGAQPYDNFKKMIDEEIAKADKLLAEKVKPEDLYAKLVAKNVAEAPAAKPAGGPPAPPPVQKIEVGSAPVKGSKTAPVTIVIFSDFQCPFCSRALPAMKEIETTYGGKVRFAFKNLPLPFHPNAQPAAAAALAANEQGKFWEYHDKLFANQQALDAASYEKYAKELGLNVAKFKASLDAKKFDAQIDADKAEAQRVGANGTPTFYINGRQLVGAQPFAAFKPIIDEELSKKK